VSYGFVCFLKFSQAFIIAKDNGGKFEINLIVKRIVIFVECRDQDFNFKNRTLQVQKAKAALKAAFVIEVKSLSS
jgi:hypothetical protein